MMHATRSGLCAASLVAFAALASAQKRYDIVDLTELAAPLGVVQSEARGINEAGQVVGFEVLDAFIERGIQWEPGGSAFLLPSLGGDNSNLAVAIAENGEALGTSEEVVIVMQGQLTLIYEFQKAVLWNGTQLSELANDVWTADSLAGSPLPYELRWTWDQNLSGQIVGWGRSFQGPPYTSHGYLFDAGQIVDLGTLDRPIAINERGEVVGYASPGQDKAYLWRQGVLTNLHDDPSITGVTSRAWGINDLDMIVGEAQFHISKPEEPALWRKGVPERLVPEINRPQGVARAVNQVGQVVGWFKDLDDLQSPFRGFLWENGVRTDLLALIPPGLGWEVLYPFALNDKGQIVGGGIRNGTLGHAFLMTPRGP